MAKPVVTTVAEDVAEEGDEEDMEAKAAALVDHKVASTLTKKEQQLGEEDEENVFSIDARLFQLLWVEVKPDTVPTQAVFGSVAINDNNTAIKEKEKDKEVENAENGLVEENAANALDLNALDAGKSVFSAGMGVEETEEESGAESEVASIGCD